MAESDTQKVSDVPDIPDGYYYKSPVDGERFQKGSPLVEPVLDPGYWKSRYETCDGEIHRSIFNGSVEQFHANDNALKHSLSSFLNPLDSVLDAGCGYGRLLDLMPTWWSGRYLGVDTCPELVEEARGRHPSRRFFLLDLCSLPAAWTGQYDVGIALWMKDMLVHNGGADAWDTIERELRRVCRRLLILSPDELRKGADGNRDDLRQE